MGGTIEHTPQGDVIACVDPRSGERTADVLCTPVEAVGPALLAARQAGQAWAELGLKRRKWAIADLHRAFLDHADELVALTQSELGRPPGETWTAEVVANHNLFKYWLSNIDDLLTAWPLHLSPIDYPKKRGQVRLAPRGVVALIAPWNLPTAISLRGLIPALLAGNAVVFKPSEHAARLGAFLAGLCEQTLPQGVVTVLQGDGAVGQALVESRPDLVLFTGSVATGRQIERTLAGTFTPTSLELGGKDAALVLDDADLERAAAGVAWGAFGFAGQNCAAVERCYVDDKVYDAFMDKLVARVQALRPLDDVGPLVNPAQLATVRRHLADALQQGAQVRAGGGEPGPGLYHPPTVLDHVTADMAVMREETFGPLLPIVRFDDLDEAVAQINRSDFGLTASVWTADLERGESIGEGLRCGVVTVNNHAFTGALPDAAWTGVGASGGGITNGRFALYEMVRPRTVVIDAMKGPHELWWYPYNPALVDVARGLMTLARPGAGRLQGVRTALSGLLNRWKDTQ